MDEVTSEIIKATVQAGLAPFTMPLSDLIGILGGDWLKKVRERNWERLAGGAKKLLEDRGVETVAPNPVVVLQIVEAAQDENREELRDIWARLLAAALDPARAPSFRREFIEIAKQLEPLDAAIIPLLSTNAELEPTRAQYVATKLSVSSDEVAVAFNNLHRLGLIWPAPREIGGSKTQPFLLPLGCRFFAAVS